MSEPQAGILPEPRRSALFLTLRVPDPARDGAAVTKAAARVPKLAKNLGEKVVSVVSFGPDFWNVVSPGARPAALRPFAPLEANGRSAPATGGDLLLHAVAKTPDLLFDLAHGLRRELGSAAQVMEEVHGFQYRDTRDLTGFIDGTENPSGNKKRAAAALIGKEDSQFAGGSYVFTQRYVHDLARWEALPLKEQEKAVGRRKRDSVELSPRRKPPTAHISRVVIEEDGEELEIVRHSFPYGTASEAGLFFIAYTRNLDIPEKMLARMIGTTGDGHHDHLMDYTRAITGANFFAPSLKMLRSLAR